MPLESGTLIPDLNQNNPLGADPKSEGDDHLRLVKRCVQGSFAAFVGTTATPKSVSLTEDQINDAALKSETQAISGQWTFGPATTVFTATLRLDNAVLLQVRDSSSVGHDAMQMTASNNLRLGDDTAGMGSAQYVVPTAFSHQFFSGADEPMRVTTLAAGSVLVTDLQGLFRKAGFRNPNRRTLNVNSNTLQDWEGAVIQITSGAPDISCAVLEQGTSVRFFSTSGSFRLLVGAVSFFRWLDGSGSLNTLSTGVNVVEGSIVEMWYGSDNIVYIFGNGISAI